LRKDTTERHKKVLEEIDEEFKKVEMQGKKSEKKEEKSIICPNCSAIITLEGRASQKIVVKCPICGEKGMVSFEEMEEKFKEVTSEKTKIRKKKEKKHASKITPYLSKIQFFAKSNIIELVLISIGVVFLFNPTLSNIKKSFTLILIGFILIFILSEKNSPDSFQTKTPKPSSSNENRKSGTRLNLNYLKKIRLSISDKITLTLVIWILFLFFITSDVELEAFFVLIFIGMLVVRELTDELTTIHLKHRMDGFIYLFLIAFIWIVGEKIINVLNM
jgi:DNA-directed RNA polymerase subunit M/transcription elongation factor TFIIS